MKLPSKKQLEAAITCSKRNVCQGCNLIIDEDADVPAECVELVAQTALEYRDWMVDLYIQLRGRTGYCPCCEKAEGHERDCELAILLEGSEVEKW